jgi:hypothetical protein
MYPEFLDDLKPHASLDRCPSPGGVIDFRRYLTAKASPLMVEATHNISGFDWNQATTNGVFYQNIPQFVIVQNG